MRTRSIRLGTGALALTFALTACADSAPTGPETPPVANNTTTPPGQLAKEASPLTGVFRGEFPGQQLCTVAPLTVTVFDAGVSWPGQPVGGLPARPVVDAGINVTRWTNPANGQWVETKLAGIATTEVTEIYDDGTFRVVQRYNGPVIQRTWSGDVFGFSAGVFALTYVVNPTGDGGFFLTDTEFLLEAGPGGALPQQAPSFCPIVEDALGD